MIHELSDPFFQVELISQTPNPQQVIYAAMHQDYSENFVHDEMEGFPSESRCGQIAVNRCLKFGHFGIVEHPQIVLNAGWFPHSTMQQIRTHRTTSFDVQSSRYTGQRIIDVAHGIRDIDEVFYLRPVGEYTDRQGKRYRYSVEDRNIDLGLCKQAAIHYADRIERGFAEEHARGLIPFDVRQHWVVSMNMRSLMHVLTIRGKGDVQIEAQKFCWLALPHFQKWAPEIAEWYIQHQWQKGRLAP